MKSVLNLLKWTVSRGSSSQNFLGAAWIPRFLATVPERSRRKWTLRILSLSPHYFVKPDLPKFRGLGYDEYLELSLRDIAASRDEIYDRVFKAPLADASTVLDLGCGPGFLAAAAARDGKTVHAADISRGAIACARVLNPSDRITYLLADAGGLSGIPDASIDAVTSLAVVQHLTEETFGEYLSVCADKLRDGGVLALHVQTANSLWRSEEEWRNDTSLTGKLRFNLGLHCFGRSIERYGELLHAKGFRDVRATRLPDFGQSDPDNSDSEHLVTAVRER